MIQLATQNSVRQSNIIGSPGDGIEFNIQAMDVHGENDIYIVYAPSKKKALQKIYNKKLFFMKCIGE